MVNGYGSGGWGGCLVVFLGGGWLVWRLELGWVTSSILNFELNVKLLLLLSLIKICCVAFSETKTKNKVLSCWIYTIYIFCIYIFLLFLSIFRLTLAHAHKIPTENVQDKKRATQQRRIIRSLEIWFVRINWRLWRIFLEYFWHNFP